MTHLAYIEIVLWTHPAWQGRDLITRGGPDSGRKYAEECAPAHELSALKFECASISKDEFEALEEFSP